ncbi:MULTISPECIES: hypothetical protein [unclassified Micromonospora]|uniref:hypothetical protein n=1 Tax=unclassified Micromonospora TaxID=2617518 RepID=UPI003A8AC193
MRTTVMFCAFDGPPLVVRLHGVGTVVPVGPALRRAGRCLGDALGQHGVRAVIVVDVQRGQ